MNSTNRAYDKVTKAKKTHVRVLKIESMIGMYDILSRQVQCRRHAARPDYCTERVHQLVKMLRMMSPG